MARRSTARHARPLGRSALAAAYAELQGELARTRRAAYDDRLEVVRLGGLVEGLVATVQRLTAQLADARSDLADARLAGAADARVESLSGEVSRLHDTVAAQQSLVADLTRRIADLLTRLDVPVPPPRPVVPPVPAAPPAYPAAEQGPSVVDLASSRAAAVRAVPPTPVALPDPLVDDETVARLRLIREAHGR